MRIREPNCGHWVTAGGEPLTQPTDRPWAVYVHVPFCVRRCLYCDFATDALDFNPSVRRDRFDRYLAAVRREILSSEARPAGTIFFGGGTPTTLRGGELLGILDTLAGHGGIAQGAEVSVEANPTTAEAGLFSALREGGFNRLSMGFQSFDDVLLERLGRTHTAAEAVAAYNSARAAGFDNVNLDLMFALPGQTLEIWRDSLQRAVALAPEHIALYGLTVEPGTPLERLVNNGRLRLVDEEVEADMYELAIDLLGEHGYEQYEISNFALPGQRCEHNQVYWRNEPYRGYGPGAASYVARRRWLNVASTEDYCDRVSAGDDPIAETEQRDESGEAKETMYLGLRMMDGVSDEAFKDRFGETPGDLYPAELSRLTDRGWTEHVNGRWRLTRAGVFLSNQVFLEFVD